MAIACHKCEEGADTDSSARPIQTQKSTTEQVTSIQANDSSVMTCPIF